MPVLAHRHVAGQERAHLLVQVARLHADHVGELVAHLVHDVVGHVAVQRPIAGRIGDELDGARAARRAPAPWFPATAPTAGSARRRSR